MWCPPAYADKASQTGWTGPDPDSSSGLTRPSVAGAAKCMMFALVAIHGKVCGAQSAVEVVTSGRRRDAHRDAQRRAAVELVIQIDEPMDVSQYGLGVGAGHARQQHHELVAADARRRRGTIDGFVQYLADAA